jgi:hypothetical protein
MGLSWCNRCRSGGEECAVPSVPYITIISLKWQKWSCIALVFYCKTHWHYWSYRKSSRRKNMWKGRTWANWIVVMTSTLRASNNGWLLKICAQYVKNKHWAPRTWLLILSLEWWQAITGASVSACHTTSRSAAGYNHVTSCYDPTYKYYTWYMSSSGSQLL